MPTGQGKYDSLVFKIALVICLQSPLHHIPLKILKLKGF
jgi:hypothetical protein